MEDTLILQTFVNYFRTLGIQIQSPTELYNGTVIAQFLASAEGSRISMQSVMRNRKVFGGAMANLNMVKAEIERLMNDYGEVLSNIQPVVNVYQIHSENNQQQLTQLLKQCLIAMTKVPNSSFFIEKILTLPQSQQWVLAELLKQDGKFMNSAQQCITIENQKCQKSNHSIIDKLYELQLENEKLYKELRNSFIENTQANEKNSHLVIQLETLKTHNLHLKSQLSEVNETVLMLNRESEKETDSEISNFKSFQEMEKTIASYKEELQFRVLQTDNLRKGYESKIEQLEQQLRWRKKTNDQLQRQLEQSQQEVAELVSKWQISQQQLRETCKALKELQSRNQYLEEAENSLKFEINHKNSQIIELKEMVSNINMTTPKVDYLVDEASTKFRSAKSLAQQLFSFNCSEPTNTNNLFFKLDLEEFDELKAEMRELQRNNLQLNELKLRNRELEYEKTKLLKVLKGYEVSRGQENDILVGCLHELRIQMPYPKGSLSKCSSGTICSL